MTFEDFKNRCVSIKSDIRMPNDDEYKIIEYVYVWNPCIDNVKGRDQIAQLYCEYGMPLIYDMVKRAKEFKCKQDEIDEQKKKLDKLKKEMDILTWREL